MGDKVDVKHFLSGTYLIDIETSLGKLLKNSLKNRIKTLYRYHIEGGQYSGNGILLGHQPPY